MRFTSSSRLALWASLLSGGWASVLPETDRHEVDANTDTANTHSEQPAHVPSTSSINVPCPTGACQENDDDFQLHVNVGQPLVHGACYHEEITINGQTFTFTTTPLDGIIKGHATIPLVSHHSQQEHAVNLRVDASCLSSPARSETGSSSGDNSLSNVARIVIESVDDKSVSSQASIDLSISDAHGHVIAGLSSPSSPESSTTDESKSSDESSHAFAPDHTPEHTPDIDEEVERLRQLRGELKDLRRLVKQQTHYVAQQAHYVNGLKADDNSHHHAPSWPKCDRSDVKCRTKVLFQKTKHCLKGCAGWLKHRVFPSTKPVRPNAEAFSAQQSFSSQMHTSTTNRVPTPSKDAQECHYTRLPASDSDTDSFIDVDDAEVRHNAAVLAFGTVASFFCLGCLALCCRQRCCSPRARADRAARREERRTRREYRILARRKAIKDWVWGFVPNARRRSSRGTNDYEEKRSLILAQENVLENAMQSQIQDLQREYGVVDGGEGSISAAERGMVRSRSTRSNSNGTRLPAYRSRASSGRPPSYSEIDNSAASSMTTLVDAFALYTPSGTGDTPDTASDATPDSSIADLSPRHSSETLRTERSL